MAVENGAPENGANGSAASTVTVTSKSTVLPAKPAASPACPLATFDLPYITFYYNQKLLLYKLDGEHRGANGGVRGGGGVGAEVVEAAAEAVAVADLADGGGGGIAEEILQQLVPYTGVMNLEGLHRPLLAVQFTKLKDGVAIGCAFNHAILDGHSTWHFMSSWAELSRGGGGGGGPSLVPILDRALARRIRVPLSLPSSPAAHESLDPNGPAKPLIHRLFSFPQTLVDQIKLATNQNPNPNPNPNPEGPDSEPEPEPEREHETKTKPKPFSTFQSLGAHVWRAVARARGLAADELTVFAVFADCRGRVDPPVSPAYFGNLIQAVFTAAPAGLLLASPPGFAAAVLQRAIDAHCAAAIAARLEGYEAAPKLFHYSDAGPNCVAVGSSPRFRVYDVDFGFGRPERVRSGSNNKFDGMVYLYPGRDGGRSIDVELTLPDEPMRRLENDDQFLPTLLHDPPL
uniref:BAHD acyltransferase DCR n=1 Tax=Ananas comosus var. bracteatus TaxID=296719 RepID=A0A6V7PJG1_ANACO|nr:unnamed protein product [Ananas comosus var. bracteatus]